MTLYLLTPPTARKVAMTPAQQHAQDETVRVLAFYADKADGLPARVRTRYRPTSYDDVKHARQPRRRYKPWSCR